METDPRFQYFPEREFYKSNAGTMTSTFQYAPSFRLQPGCRINPENNSYSSISCTSPLSEDFYSVEDRSNFSEHFLEAFENRGSSNVHLLKAGNFHLADPTSTGHNCPLELRVGGWTTNKSCSTENEGLDYRYHCLSPCKQTEENSRLPPLTNEYIQNYSTHQFNLGQHQHHSESPLRETTLPFDQANQMYFSSQCQFTPDSSSIDCGPCFDRSSSLDSLLLKQTFECQPGSRSTCEKRKRKRVINKVQRQAANLRERKRMNRLNSAFEQLWQKMPKEAFGQFSKNLSSQIKFSRVFILRSALCYIEYLKGLLDNDQQSQSIQLTPSV